MSLFNMAWKIALSFAIAWLSVFIMSIDPGFSDDRAFISFWIFIGMLVVLNISLVPDENTIQDKINNIHKHRDLESQLTEVRKLISNIERTRNTDKERLERLFFKRKTTFERIEKLRKAVTLEMREKNKKQIEEYTQRVEEMKLVIEELEKSVSVLDEELSLLYKESNKIESAIKVNHEKKKVLDKKAQQVFKV